MVLEVSHRISLDIVTKTDEESRRISSLPNTHQYIVYDKSYAASCIRGSLLSGPKTCLTLDKKMARCIGHNHQ